jgi:hypothetical protein
MTTENEREGSRGTFEGQTYAFDKTTAITLNVQQGLRPARKPGRSKPCPFARPIGRANGPHIAQGTHMENADTPRIEHGEYRVVKFSGAYTTLRVSP